MADELDIEIRGGGARFAARMVGQSGGGGALVPTVSLAARPPRLGLGASAVPKSREEQQKAAATGRLKRQLARRRGDASDEEDVAGNDGEAEEKPASEQKLESTAKRRAAADPVEQLLRERAAKREKRKQRNKDDGEQGAENALMLNGKQEALASSLAQITALPETQQQLKTEQRNAPEASQPAQQTVATALPATQRPESNQQAVIVTDTSAKRKKKKRRNKDRVPAEAAEAKNQHVSEHKKAEGVPEQESKAAGTSGQAGEASPADIFPPTRLGVGIFTSTTTDSGTAAVALDDCDFISNWQEE